MPPIPTAAIFNLSDGAICPWLLPNTELGTIVNAAAAAVLLCRKDLLEMFDIVIFFYRLILNNDILTVSYLMKVTIRRKYRQSSKHEQI